MSHYTITNTKGDTTMNPLNSTISIRVPDRVRMPSMASLDAGRERHGYGEAGDRLYAKLCASSNRTLLSLEADELDVIVDYAEALYVCSADDARHDADARYDRSTARRFLIAAHAARRTNKETR